MSYLVCSNCKGYYKLQDGETIEDFKSCRCGGELKQYKSLYEFLDEQYGLNYSEIIKEKRRLKEEHNQLKENYKVLNDEYLKQVSDNSSLKMDNSNFESENKRLKEIYDALKIEFDELTENYQNQATPGNDLKVVNSGFEVEENRRFSEPFEIRDFECPNTECSTAQKSEIFEDENIALKESYDILKLEHDSLADDYLKTKVELEKIKEENDSLLDNQLSQHFELNIIKEHNMEILTKNEELKDNLTKLKYVLSQNSKTENNKLTDSKSNEVRKLKGLKKPKSSEKMSYEELNAAYNMLLEMFTKLKEENSILKKNESLNHGIIHENGVETGK